MNAYVIHVVAAPEHQFSAYVIPGVTAIDRSAASIVILRGDREVVARLSDGTTAKVKATVATLALGPGVTVVLGDRPPQGVRLAEADDDEDRRIGFEAPEGGDAEWPAS